MWPISLGLARVWKKLLKFDRNQMLFSFFIAASWFLWDVQIKPISTQSAGPLQGEKETAWNVSSIAALNVYWKKNRKSDSLDCNFYAGAAAVAATSSFGLASSKACSWRIAWGKPGKSLLVAYFTRAKHTVPNMLFSFLMCGLCHFTRESNDELSIESLI